MNIDANPFASPAVVDDGYEAAVVAEKGTVEWNERWDRITLIGIVLTCVFGAILCNINIETIVFSGGILFGLSAFLYSREVVLAKRGRPKWLLARTISAIGAGIPIVVFATIATYDWSPEDATKNGIPFYISIAAPIITAICVLAYFRVPRTSEFKREESSQERKQETANRRR